MAASEQPAAAMKRRHKAQYVSGQQAKRPRGGGGGGPRQLELGMQGILITCNMNERKCVGEAYSLLNEYGDLLYGPEKVRAASSGPAGRALCPGRSAGGLAWSPLGGSRFCAAAPGG